MRRWKIDTWFWGEYSEQGFGYTVHQWRGYGWLHVYLGDWVLEPDDEV